MNLEQFLIDSNKATFNEVIKFWQFHVLSGTPINKDKAIAAYKAMYEADETEFVFTGGSFALQKLCNTATYQLLGEPVKSLDEYSDTFDINALAETIKEQTGDVFNALKIAVEGEFEGVSNTTRNRFGRFGIEISVGEAMLEIARLNSVHNASYKHVNFLDFNKIAALDFLTKVGIIKDNEAANCIIELALSGVYGLTVFGTEKVVVLPLPTVSLIEGKISSAKQLAVRFPDGTGLAMWKNLRIPAHLVTEPITKNTILHERNAETKRCIKEMIGTEKFVELLDVMCIHEDFDNQGNVMRLLRSREKDKAIVIGGWRNEESDGYLYFINVVCPSTMREYYLSVKPTNDVWEAKRSLFRGKKILYRHGDVGLLRLNTCPEHPIHES